jgi:hypothetical protein
MSNGEQHVEQQQPLFQYDDFHVIENDDSEKNEDLASDDHSLNDALEAWQEISALVSRIGRSLIKREVVAIKRSAEEISQRCNVQFPHLALQEDENRPSERDLSSIKRRRVSGYENCTLDIVKTEEKEALIKRMERMKRVNAVLFSLNNSHGLLEQEIRIMIDEESPVAEP